MVSSFWIQSNLGNTGIRLSSSIISSLVTSALVAATFGVSTDEGDLSNLLEESFKDSSEDSLAIGCVFLGIVLVVSFVDDLAELTLTGGVVGVPKRSSAVGKTSAATSLPMKHFWSIWS